MVTGLSRKGLGFRDCPGFRGLECGVSVGVESLGLSAASRCVLITNLQKAGTCMKVENCWYSSWSILLS